MGNGTNGFSLITFDGGGVQLCFLQSFCSKFNGGSERLFRFWICFIFYGQNTLKMEHVLFYTEFTKMTSRHSDRLHLIILYVNILKTFLKACCTAYTSILVSSFKSFQTEVTKRE